MSQGSASRLGSVFVNGVRYEVDGAQIVVNGTAATPAALKAGQVLQVVGDVEVGGREGDAESVTYENTVRGRVTQLSLVDRTLTILGQQVRVGLETVFAPDISPGDIESLSVGDDLVVSAFVDANGQLRASRIDRDGSPGTAEVVGAVSAVDSVAKRFQLNALVVDYRTAVPSGFTGSDPSNGDLVRVTGPLPAAGSPLAATTLASRTPLVGATDDNVNVEGLVTRLASGADFDVGGQRVVTNASTAFVGTTSAALQVNDFVDVQGKRDATGGLVAVRVEAFPPADIQIEARLDAVDAAAGTLGLLGITVNTTARTRFVADDDGAFSLADLRAGDAVEIAGYVADGRFVAVRVENDDDGGEVEIEGPATDLADPEFRIGGIRIVTDALTEFDDTSRAEFFSTGAGRRVEVEGTWTGTFVLATEVELDN
mgnify:CR=1 FL=1